MTDDAGTAEMNTLIADERSDLADLPEGQWDAATLCAGWQVREVVRGAARRRPAAECRHPVEAAGGLAGALSHDFIHALDITVGLGLEHHLPLDRGPR